MLQEPEATPVTDSERMSVAARARRQFGFPQLRDGQADVLVRALRGEDVLAIMPTGGGKSLCYQLPAALERRGVTLVVSPLIALMKDQLEGLPDDLRSNAVAITSELHPDHVRRAVEDLGEGRYRLVYAAPERLRQPAFLRALRKAGVARFVIDEAHCVSAWGHDFRPDYLGLRAVRDALGSPPLLALTATAPPHVEKDIQEQLGPLQVVRASVNRPNLRFEAILAKNADEKLAHLHRLCVEARDQGQLPGIVYANSRDKCEQIANALSMSGIRALAYHAGLPDRSERQDAFMHNEAEVLVATVAFGMGVDKADIRFVYHFDPSASLENYYQEAGRAGRDGKPARCVVLATQQDATSLKRRARGDLPSRDLIQNCWALVLNHVHDAAGGREVVVPLDELADLSPNDHTGPRVALSILTEAGALERVTDVPLRLRVRGMDPRLRAFERGGAWILDVAAALDVGAGEVETRLLEREALGELTFQTSGRGVLYRVTGDLSRVEDVLEAYGKRAMERVEDIMAYVKARACRHALLRRHFGETGAPACDGACDVCLKLEHETPDAPGGDDAEAARRVLETLGGVRGIGFQNLVFVLRGDERASEWTRRLPTFGTLAFRSESSIKGLVDRVEAAGLAEREKLEHGGNTLRLTHEGARRLHADGAVLPDAPAAPPERGSAGAALGSADAALFQALREWRREQADAEGVPPYVVAPDKTLAAIAAARPSTEAALLAVNGMGPKRVEKYGADILRVVSSSSSG